MGIFNLTLNSINNTTLGVTDGYRDYSCTIGTTITIGQSYPISIRTNANADENVRVWLDLNNDGAFNSATELLFTSDAARLHTGTIIVPVGTVLNTPLRLRVAADYVNAPIPTPCSTPLYSQTEDYAVTITANSATPLASFTATSPLTCSGLIAFADQSQNAPTSWLWSFGDGQTSTQQHPQHQYTAPGNYTVSLTVTNSAGTNTSTRSNYITYNSQVPVAAACTPATTAYCCGYGITQFTFGSLVSSSADASAGYEDFTCTRRLSVPAGSRLPWVVRTGGANVHDVRGYLDLNDDGQFTASELLFSAPSQRNPAGEIILPASGTQNRPLRLRVVADAVGTGSGPCPTASLGQVEDYTLTITPTTTAPSPQAISSYALGCDTLIHFTDQTAFVPTSWLWTFGDGATSTQQHPQHSYSQAGSYRVQLRTCNAFGCDTLSAALVLRINGRAVRSTACAPTISRPLDRPYYAIRELQFHTIANVTGDALEGYGDFTCTHRAFVSAGGRYPVLVRSPAPTYNFRSRVWIDFNNDGVFTEPQELAFAGDDDAPQHAGFVQVPTNAVLNVPLRIRVLGAYDGPTLAPCSTMLYGQVEDYSIVVLPATTPTEPWFTISQDSVCAGSIVAFQLTNQSPPSGSTIAWNFGDGSTATQVSATHVYSAAGTYTVRATLCTPAGCRTVTQTVHVTASYPTRASICARVIGEEGWELRYGIDSVRLHTLGYVNRDFETLYRDFSCSRNVRLRPGQAYTLRVGGRTAEPRVMRAYLDANNDGIFSPSELWAIGGANPVVFTQTVTVPTAAVQNVPLRLRILTDSDFPGTDPCQIARGQALDFSVTVSNTVLSASISHEEEFLYVMPNPVTDKFIVHYSVEAGKSMTLTLTNATGQLVHQRQLRSDNSQEIQLSANEIPLTEGLYFLRFTTKGYSRGIKLLAHP